MVLLVERGAWVLGGGVGMGDVAGWSDWWSNGVPAGWSTDARTDRGRFESGRTRTFDRATFDRYFWPLTTGWAALGPCVSARTPLPFTTPRRVIHWLGETPEFITCYKVPNRRRDEYIKWKSESLNYELTPTICITSS